MNAFKGFVIKECYHIFRDKRTLFVLFGMPLAMMLIFGYVITNEIKDANIAILDMSKDDVTKQITSKLSSSGYFKIKAYLNSEKEIQAYFKNGSVKEVVVFEPDFAQKLLKEGKASVHIIADASDANFANIVTGYTSNIINNYSASMNSSVGQVMRIVPEVRMMYNPDMKGVFMFVPGIMALVLVLISALMTSVSIVREKEMGTMEVLLVSPLKPLQIIVGKVIPYILLAFLDAVIIIVLANFVFELPIKGSLLLLLGEALLFILLALSLGIFISTNNDTQQNAMMISMLALMLPTLLLSGFIFPIDNMPIWLQVVCRINPSTYFIDILKTIMEKGLGFAYVWKQTLVLAFVTLFLLVASSKKFKTRLE